MGWPGMGWIGSLSQKMPPSFLWCREHPALASQQGGTGAPRLKGPGSPPHSHLSYRDEMSPQSLWGREDQTHHCSTLGRGQAGETEPLLGPGAEGAAIPELGVQSSPGLSRPRLPGAPGARGARTRPCSGAAAPRLCQTPEPPWSLRCCGGRSSPRIPRAAGAAAGVRSRNPPGARPCWGGGGRVPAVPAVPAAVPSRRHRRACAEPEAAGWPFTHRAEPRLGAGRAGAAGGRVPGCAAAPARCRVPFAVARVPFPVAAVPSPVSRAAAAGGAGTPRAT